MNEIFYSDKLGTIKISDDVVTVIAEIAAKEVSGVSSMAGGFVGNISEMLGKKNVPKGVKVEVGETEAAVDIYLTVEHGVSIPEVATEVQENVKKNVETMTGLNVIEVNVHVQGVTFPKELKDGQVED